MALPNPTVDISQIAAFSSGAMDAAARSNANAFQGLTDFSNGIKQQAQEKVAQQSRAEAIAKFNGEQAAAQATPQNSQQSYAGSIGGFGQAPAQTSKGMPVNEQVIYEGLLARGFTPVQAKGSLMNFKDESGLVADITEGKPNAMGTRGQGLYQLTDNAQGVGRRNDYLNFMQQNGRKDAWSVDSQLDFYKWETQNTEKANWNKFANAATEGEFAAGMVQHFLRPAKEHMISRQNRYLGRG